MIYWRKRNDFQIVSLLDNGNNPKQVARELSISIWTVYRACKRFHVEHPQKNAKGKITKNNRIELK
jgi:hypothetical protein